MRSNFERFAFPRTFLSEVIRIGVPAGIQSLVITLSNVMVQYHINSISEDAIAAFTAYFKVELIIYLPIVAMGQAAMAFAGQCKGADDREGIRKGTKICLLLSIIMTIVISVLALLCGAALFRVFIKEKAVIELGCRIIRISFPFYFLYCILQILGDSLRGCGEVRCPMLIVADEHMSASNGTPVFDSAAGRKCGKRGVRISGYLGNNSCLYDSILPALS